MQMPQCTLDHLILAFQNECPPVSLDALEVILSYSKKGQFPEMPHF